MSSKKIESHEQFLARILQPLLRHIASQLNAEGCLILMRDPNTEMFLIVSITEDHKLGPGSVVRPDEDMVSRVALTRKPLIVNNYREWSGRSLDLTDTQMRRDALLCVPLLWEEEYLGGLVVSAVSGHRQFSTEDVPALEFFAPIVAALLSRCKAQSFRPDYQDHLQQEVDAEIKELHVARLKMAEDADQLRNLLADTVAIQEEERSRIAGDLHDGFNQLIIGAIYEIQVAQQRLISGKLSEAGESLEAAKELLRHIEAENRVLINDLQPPMLKNHGLVVTFKWYLDQFLKRHGYLGSLEVKGEPQRLSPDIEIAVYRIVQEALNNAHQHAGAGRIDLQVEFRPEMLCIAVQDDGCGFDPKDRLPDDRIHFGLISQRERALSIGAQLEIRSSPAHGTRLLLSVPMANNPENPVVQLEQRRNVRVAYTQNITHPEGDGR